MQNSVPVGFSAHLLFGQRQRYAIVTALRHLFGDPFAPGLLLFLFNGNLRLLLSQVDRTMFGEVGRLREFLGTELALKLLVAHVNGPVFVQIARTGEGLVAKVALIGPFARVQQEVPAQVVRLAETHPAVAARVRFLPRVNQLVGFQRRRLTEGLPAGLTLVFFGRHVSAGVFLQTGIQRQHFTAHVAQVIQCGRFALVGGLVVHRRDYDIHGLLIVRALARLFLLVLFGHVTANVALGGQLHPAERARVQSALVVRLVDHHVSFHVGHLGEGLAAVGAQEGLVARVDAPVASHRSVITELLGAVLAGEGTFPGVQPLVLDQPRLQRKGFPTSVALESLFFGVNGQVLPHVRQLGASVRAEGTRGGFLARVGPHVLAQVGAVVESSLAHFALQGFHAFVFDGVQFQVVAAQKLLAADVADVGFGPVVNVHVPH